MTHEFHLNLNLEWLSVPKPKLMLILAVALTLAFVLQAGDLPAEAASNVKYYLQRYDAVPMDNFKLRQERLEELISALKFASKKEAKAAPKLIELLRNLMQIQIERGDAKGALATSNYIVEKISELCPLNDDAEPVLINNHIERARAYLVLRSPEEALDELALYKQSSPPLSDQVFYNPKIDYLEALSNFQLGDKKSALELANRILSKTKNYPALLSLAHTLLSEIHASEGDNDRALDEANRALEFPSATAGVYVSERAKALCARANALLGSKRVGEALADAEQASRLNPDLKDAYLALARVFKEKNEREKALQCLDKCLAIDSGLPAAVALRKDLNRSDPGRIETDSAKSQSSSQASLPESQSHSKSPIRDKWAIVVGISRFQNPSLNLKYADKDAQDFKDYLVNEGHFAPDHVKMLLNESASREEILSTLGDSWLPRVVLPRDLVVIYMSTHGSPSSFDVKGVNYLLAYDTKVDSLYATGIAIQDLVRIIKARVNTDRIVMILDACHSGSAEMPGGKGIVRAANVDAGALLQGVGQVVLASSDVNQRSWEFKNKPNGVFTYCLIDSLRKAGKNGDLFRAFNTMKEQVQTEVLKERGILQEPVLKSKWTDASLELAVPAAEPRKGI